MPSGPISADPLATLANTTIFPVITPSGSVYANQQTPLSAVKEFILPDVVNVPASGGDDTAALQAAVAALPAKGGIIQLEAADYSISSTLWAGDGSAAALSTRHCVLLRGVAASSLFSTTGTSAMLSGTRILWKGASGGTMIEFRGPMVGGGLERIHLICNATANKAGIALKLKHLAHAVFRELGIFGYSATGIRVDTDTLPAFVLTGGDDCLWENVICLTDVATADALDFGADDSAKSGLSRHIFNGCVFRSDVATTGRAAKFRFADNHTFVQTIFHSGSSPIEIIPPSGSTVFPGAMSFVNCAITGSIAVTGTWTSAHGFNFYPFSSTDGGTLNYDATKVIHGVDTQGRFFGPHRDLTTVYSAIAASTAIANTASLTQFSVSKSIAAGRMNLAGATVRVRAGGKFSCTGTPTANITSFMGGQQLLGLNLLPCPSGASNQGWAADFTFIVRATGTSGTICVGPGVGGLAGSTVPGVSAVTGATRTLNLTTANTLGMFWQWSAADPANTVTLETLEIDINYPKDTS